MLLNSFTDPLCFTETTSIKKSKTEDDEVIELSSDSEDDNNENLQQPMHMPKLTTFGDNNVSKSISSFNAFSHPFSSQACSQAPSGNLDHSRGQSRGLITRYFKKVDHKQNNLEK